MAEYIERDATIKLLKHIGAPAYAVNAVSLVEPIHFFADVAPVVHGRWVKQPTQSVDVSTELSMCSVCAHMVPTYWGRTNYCSNCGARMDGGAD